MVLEIFLFNKVYLLVNYHCNMNMIYCKNKNQKFEKLNCSFFCDRSKEEKCTKAQPCSSGICTWNQHIIFFDIDTIDNIILWIKLINLDNNQDVLGEIKFNKLNLNNKGEWYNLNGLLKNKKNFYRKNNYL